MEREENPQRVLVVDDEPAIRDVVARYLRDEGFIVDEAGDGIAALERAAASPPDLLILDLNLPHLSGVEVFRRLRERSDVPVIMLTSRVNEVDRVVGLELGADDYVGKPFSPREVVARVKTVLRRYHHAPAAGAAKAPGEPPQRVGELEIDRAGHEVRVRGKSVALTPMEFKILEVLASNLGRAFSRDQLLDKVSADGGAHVFDRTLDRHIANLRQKVEADPARPRYVVTVFGVGYKLVEGA
jgi:two-component system response regulator BaeR